MLLQTILCEAGVTNSVDEFKLLNQSMLCQEENGVLSKSMGAAARISEEDLVVWRWLGTPSDNLK